MKTIVLLSGGIDSTVALAMTLPNVGVAVSFDYGQTHSREIDHAKAIALYYDVPHEVVSIGHLIGKSALTYSGEIPEAHAEAPDATEVPGRNIIMVSIAVGGAKSWGCGAVVIGANADDRAGYPDCRPDFIEQLDGATRAGYGVSIHAPLLKMTKRDIVARGRQLSAPLDLTWSCYRGGSEPCNRCGACESTNEALAWHT